jgi:superfamily II DNA/RNA helicase
MARDAAIASLRAGECDVLVATDVAARGLDLPGVELVIHADLPRSAGAFLFILTRAIRLTSCFGFVVLFTDAYAHRAGRAGRPGCAVRGASLLLPPPGPEHAAAVARLERDAKVAVRRLTAVGEREARGRSVAAAAAASAAAASRSSDGLLDGVGVATSSPVSEEDARVARARLGERMLVADRFGEFTGELSELRGGRSGKSGKSRGKGKGRR